MFAALVLALLQGPPTFPARDYQPRLMDPGLHGGRISRNYQEFDGPSDLTPDGRVRIGFRQQEYFPDLYFWALVACPVDPERIQADPNGHLSSFYDPTDPVTWDVFIGQDFAMSSITESKVIYWSPPFQNADTEITTDDDWCTLDPGLPLPNGGKSANVTLVMETDPVGSVSGENPYPSDASGVFQLEGEYRTYKLLMVTDHHGLAGDWTCGEGAFLQWQLCPLVRSGYMGDTRVRAHG